MLKKKYTVCLKKLVLFMTLSVISKSSFADENKIHNSSLLDIALSQLKFVGEEQTKQDSSLYIKGEWPSKISAAAIISMIGVGRYFSTDEEPTGFTTAAIANQLAITYLAHPELRDKAEVTQIPSLLENSIHSFYRYKEPSNDLYNYYPSVIYNGVKVRQPLQLRVKKLWLGLTNIPEDADSTSIIYTTQYYSSVIQNQEFQLPEKVSSAFSKFRDLDRAPGLYNKLHNRVNTGAFMTWLQDKNDPLAAKSTFARPEDGQRIPGKNDVDCVINSRILLLLTLANQTQIPGYAESCQMINDMIIKKEQASCGAYYPNTYNLSYILAHLNSSGSKCLQENSKSELLNSILKTQNEDGSWITSENLWKDKVQSTVFAMTGLLEFGDTQNAAVKTALDKGISFLIQNLEKSADDSYFLKGEVFFSAVPIIRSLVVWRSHSYTTSIAAEVFLKMHQLFPNQDLEYYEKIPRAKNTEESIAPYMRAQ